MSVHALRSMDGQHTCAIIMNIDCSSRANSKRLPSQKKHRVIFANNLSIQRSAMRRALFIERSYLQYGTDITREASGIPSPETASC